MDYKFRLAENTIDREDLEALSKWMLQDMWEVTW